MIRAAEKTDSPELIAAPAIEKRILVVRGRQVMLDEDLADLYGVETKRLIEQVKRNVERFPAAFVELRRAAASYFALEERLRELERETTARFGRHDEHLDQIFKTLRQLISPPARPKRPVGFRLPDDDR
jgi:hypothetical protein